MPQEITRLFDFAYYQQKMYPHGKCFNHKVNGVWTSVSTEEYITKANTISRFLLKLGIKKEDKIVVITSTNRPEWSMLDLAILQIGAINVPLYPNITVEDYEYIINHSDAEYCFVSDLDLFKKVDSIKKNTKLKAIYSFDILSETTNWNQLLELAADMELQPQIEVLKKEIDPKQTATIIYTSGTTGTPKGVMLSHFNLVSNTFDGKDMMDIPVGRFRVMSFLPVCHIFERFALYYYQYMGFEIYFAESIEKLGVNIKEVHPHFMPVVPRLIEKIYDKITATARELSLPKRIIFNWSVRVGKKFSPKKLESSIYNFKLNLARKLVFVKWKEAMGGEIRFMLSGSAALQPNLIRVFAAAEIPVIEGYGMTETSPGIALNSMIDGNNRTGSVGKILNNVTVKIAEDGEILVKGSNVMQGYYKDEKKTKESVIDGFLHTGDIGRMDADGYLYITDRKKEMFKTSGGKYIAPTHIEGMFKQSGFIEQIMVVGEGEKMPAALILINFDFVNKWAKQHQFEIKENLKALSNDSRVIDRIQKELDHYNPNFGKWEQIKKFELTPIDWTIDNGLLTPTLKIKRKQIMKKFQKLVTKIYS
ncbi:MAG: long-chain fatty acid--CoA ligase [Flavobacteriaceae bacterium]|nr:MAG: long-chain fatty acid--CoA ligase [Flavobacteriaceae bacterium]